jgi:hypothetical protein
LIVHRVEVMKPSEPSVPSLRYYGSMRARVNPARVWSLPDNAPKHPLGCGEYAVRRTPSWKPYPGEGSDENTMVNKREHL